MSKGLDGATLRTDGHAQEMPLNDRSTYELQETIEGVTFTYRGRGTDPVVANAPSLRNNGGDFEEMLLRSSGDDSVMPIVDARPITFDLVSILAYEGKARFWRYTIDTLSQTWTRDDGKGPSAARPVSDLRIRIDRDGEIEHTPVQIQIAGTRGEYVAVIHPGSTCRMVWNPATRRYVQVCS
jgi:hypothetical protein